MPLQEVEDVVEEAEAEDSMAAPPGASMVALVECVVAGKDFEAAPGSSAEATDLDAVCMETR